MTRFADTHTACQGACFVVRGIGDDFKEQVRSSTSLVDLVSEVVALKPLRGGSDYVGLCPFHTDRNPSLHVYPERQTYRCWSCDEGGDCFRWVMEIEKIDFREAIEALARRANIEIPTFNRKRGALSEQSRVDRYAVLEWAVTLMQNALRSSATESLVRRYVAERNLSAETVRDFRIGFHPEDWNWFLQQASGKFTPRQLTDAGLIQQQRSGNGYFDNLVGRLVFPILDERSRPVAFGGRLIPGSNIESDAKYWNSQESTIFHKRRMLYAFDRSREPIRRGKTAIVVEGYMDCIACQQAGLDNVVATLGTAMTEEHVRFLRRFAEQVVLIYDGDEAGQRAAERSISRFLAQDLDLRVLTLADGQDPADFLEQHSVDHFRQQVEQAPEAWEYKLQNLTARIAVDTVSGRQQVLNEMLDLVKDAPGLAGTVREDLIIKSLCWRIQADERSARQQLQQLRGQNKKRNQIRQRNVEAVPTADISLDPADHRAERELLEIILTSPETVDVIGHHIGVDDFEHPLYRTLLGLCLDLRKEDGDLPELDRIVSVCDSDSELLNLVNAVLDTAEEKDILRLMTESSQEPSDAADIPLHLQRVLIPLLDRREKKLQVASKQRMAQADSPASQLNSDAREALARLYSFRKSQMGHPSAMK
jgi:DNA primase